MLANYTYDLTEDGSPTLTWDSKEAMHNRKGAYSETQYIYGDALRMPGLGGRRSVYVVGLGLGYIELLAVAEALKAGEIESLSLLTAEIDPGLVREFLNWLRFEQSALKEACDLLYSFYQRDYPGLDLKGTLLKLYENGQWQIMGELNLETIPKRKFTHLLFDAFSSKSTPALWDEYFLEVFLNQLSEIESTVFATYACKGILVRALKKEGYHVIKKTGFSGKRDSTLALRGTASLHNL